jgi:hypothetical protein
MQAFADLQPAAEEGGLPIADCRLPVLKLRENLCSLIRKLMQTIDPLY